MKTNYQRGRDGEESAQLFLKVHKYKIIDTNWKNKFCEIDIVAKLKKRIYFVEVKSRKSVSQGSGYDYITAKKLNQMKFAAEYWVATHKWEGEYQLAVISIDDDKISFIDQLT